MQLKGSALLAAGAALAISLGTASAQSLTNGKFNGAWTVAFTTEKGLCERLLQYGVAIRNGSIAYKGDGSLNVSGRVDDGGRVEVTLEKGAAKAAATGQLQLASGAGTWQLPSLGCTGRWSAARL